jgi:hypothetical protein
LSGPISIGDALARALGEIQTEAMREIARTLGWPLDHEAWQNPEAIPDRDCPLRPLAVARSPEEVEARCRAIAQVTPPTYPRALEIYDIAAERGPGAAKAAIQASVKAGDITRLQANTLIWVMALENI